MESRWDDPDFRKNYLRFRLQVLKNKENELENPLTREEKKKLMEFLIDEFQQGNRLDHPHYELGFYLKRKEELGIELKPQKEEKENET